MITRNNKLELPKYICDMLELCHDDVYATYDRLIRNDKCIQWMNRITKNSNNDVNAVLKVLIIAVDNGYIQELEE